MGAVIGSSLLLSSCNFLDVDNYFQATFKEDSIFHSMKNAEGYLWNTPTRFPDAGAIWGNSWNPGRNCLGRDCRQMADQRVLGERNSVLVLVNGRNLRQDIWYSMYVVVARCNRMLENIDKVSDMTEADRRRYIGYVHFMRGYAYYHLLMNYGPLLIVGDEVLGTSESAEYYDRERSTYDESVDYICNEFKLATQGIYGPTEQSISYSDRPTKGGSFSVDCPSAPVPSFSVVQWR